MRGKPATAGDANAADLQRRMGGVRLADLLAECIPSSEARFVWSTGADYGVFDGVPCDLM